MKKSEALEALLNGLIRGGTDRPMIHAVAMIAALAAALTVTAATGVAAAPATVEIVDLVIAYDDEVWRI